jgi:hypothetical protein
MKKVDVTTPCIILLLNQGYAFVGNSGKVRANAYDMVLNGNEMEVVLFVFTIKRRNN